MKTRAIIRGWAAGLAMCVVVGQPRAQDAVLASPPPMSLQEAIQEALARNKQIKVEGYAKTISRANLLAEWGKFDPAVAFQRNYQQAYSNIGASYATDPVTGQIEQTAPVEFEFVQADNYALGLEGSTPWGLQYNVGGNAQYLRYTVAGQFYPDGYQSFGGVTFTQPLLRGFGFGTNLQGVRVARADKGISEWGYRQTVIDTVTNVIFAFSDLELARDNLRIAMESRQLAAGLLAENEKRYKVGSMSQSDVIQAKSREGFREEPILVAERGVKDGENALRALLGEEKFSPDGPDLPIQPMAERMDVAISPAEDLKRAYDLRPDYQSARLGIRKLEANEAGALNQLLPQVDFVGSYGYNGLASDFQDSRRMVFDRDNRAYTAGLVVTVPLTFAQGRGRYRSAKLQRMQSEADLQRLEQDIALSVAGAAGQVETTQARIATAKRAYGVGQQALDAEVKKLRSGYSTTFVVLQLQEDMIDLESRVAQARADHRRAVAAYDREIGTTLERNDVTLAQD